MSYSARSPYSKHPLHQTYAITKLTNMVCPLVAQTRNSATAKYMANASTFFFNRNIDIYTLYTSHDCFYYVGFVIDTYPVYFCLSL